MAIPRRGFDRTVAGLPSLYCSLCPHPPDPRSQSALPSGKGENHSFLMQGASPLASPGLGGKAALEVGGEVVFDRGLPGRHWMQEEAIPRRWV